MGVLKDYGFGFRDEYARRGRARSRVGNLMGRLWTDVEEDQRRAWDEKYQDAMLSRGIREAVGRAFGDDRETRLSQENERLRGMMHGAKLYNQAMSRDLQRVGGEKQGVSSAEMDPYQMARQIPGMERKGAMTTVAGGGGASNMDMVGMDPTANSPEVATGTDLPLGAMDTGTTLMPPPNPNDEDVIPRASGGPLQRGGVHMVGEAGRELVVPRGDGGYQVIPHGTTEAVMARNPQMRVEGHQWGGEIDDYPGYTPIGGVGDLQVEQLKRPTYVTPTNDLQRSMGPYEYYGGPEVVTERPVPEQKLPEGSYEAYFDPGVGSAQAPLARTYTPQARTYAPGAFAEAVPGAESERPVSRSYYDEMAQQWNKPAPATAPPTSAQLARTRPVTLIRGTNVTYANPSVTGEQEFSTPQMAREAAMYTPEAQAEMFELKRRAANAAVANLEPGTGMNPKALEVLARQQQWGANHRANVQLKSIDPITGQPMLTTDANNNTITHPSYLRTAVGKLVTEAPGVKSPEDGIDMVEQMKSLVSGHPEETGGRAIARLLQSMPVNVAQQVQAYYAAKKKQPPLQRPGG